jgi:hypothetical protein
VLTFVYHISSTERNVSAFIVPNFLNICNIADILDISGRCNIQCHGILFSWQFTHKSNT